jgi:hypothetical protein
MYDRTAKILTEKFAAGELPVIEAEMLENGEIIIEITESVRFEVFPVCSGPAQSRRLFEKGSDVHYLYPESADRESSEAVELAEKEPSREHKGHLGDPS